MAKKAARKASKKVAKKVSKKLATKGLAKTSKKVSKKVSKKKTPTKVSKAVAPKINETVVASSVGQKVPSVAVVSTAGGSINLAELKNKKIVLYFYPKDSTPGCTLEGYDFKRLQSEFSDAGAVIFGVSKDSLKSHQNFKQKCGFPFELLVDDEEKLCRAFDVIQMKSLYGRQYL